MQLSVTWRRASVRPAPAIGTLLAVLLLLALAARMGFLLAEPTIGHADELFQYAEQAYRVVSGRGLVPWEYRLGIRSWFLPGLLVPVVWLARLVAPGPESLWIGVTLFTSLLSLLVVLSAYGIGRAAGGRAAGFWAAALTAFWPEIVHFSPHFLADTVCAVPLTAAAALLYRGQRTAGTATVLGVLLGLSLFIRPQLVLAVLVVAAAAARWDVRLWMRLAAGGLASALAFGTVDWLTVGYPFSSLVNYVGVNAGGVASAFGEEGPLYYLRKEVGCWRLATPVLVVAAVVGVKRAPVLALAAAAVFVTMSLIAHKEPRFVFPALPLLTALCGIGTARLIEAAPGWVPLRTPDARVWAAVGAWGLAILAAGLSPSFQYRIGYYRQSLEVQQRLRDDGRVCGVAMDPASLPPASITDWTEMPLMFLRDEVGLFEYRSGGDHRPFNVLFATRSHDPARYGADGFRPAGCVPGPEVRCLYRRPGGCSVGTAAPLRASPPPRVAALLERMGYRP